MWGCWETFYSASLWDIQLRRNQCTSLTCVKSPQVTVQTSRAEVRFLVNASASKKLIYIFMWLQPISAEDRHVGVPLANRPSWSSPFMEWVFINEAHLREPCCTPAESRVNMNPGGRRLRQWLIEQINSNIYNGLLWEDENRTMFRIPWKHAGKQDYNQEVDASIFKVSLLLYWCYYMINNKNYNMILNAKWMRHIA